MGMNKKYFHPSLFLDIIKELGEASVKDIAKKARCSETTAESNLKLLREDFLAIRKWKYGMWMHRALSKKETYDKKWRAEHHEQSNKANKESARRQRERDNERVKKAHRDWARNNPEKIKAYCDKWRTKNRDYDLQKKREWYQKNKR